MIHRLHLARDTYKFSCAHMTVFPDGSKEQLHGHNFTVSVSVRLSDLSFERMIPFSQIKKVTSDLCNGWKEHLLLAQLNPYLKIVRHTADELEFRLCDKRYVVPAEDAILLPIDNVCVESLAAHICERLMADLRSSVGISSASELEVTVEESPGQGASCCRDFC